MRRDITGMHFSVGDDIICVSFLQIVRTIGQVASGGRSWPTVRHLLCSTLHCNFLYAPPVQDAAVWLQHDIAVVLQE